VQFGLMLAFFLAWGRLGWGARVGCAALYAFGIGWSLDSVAHNFIHNPFFASRRLNRLTSFVLTWALGVPQTMYAYVHMRHHAGNSDKPGPDGATVDPISLYQYGADGRAEPMLTYVFGQFWRDAGPFEVAREIRAKRPLEARQALQEFWSMVALYGLLLALNWRFVLLLAPSYYLGQCLSFLIAYYEHLGADPATPIATGVSSYAPVYNWAFLNNGYHAEHHFRPKWHWSKMKALRAELGEQMAAARVRTIRSPHFVGFLEPSSWRVPVARARRRPAALPPRA
jgi:fatty acid desaturase